ncbi:MAG: hypothetical protein F6K55_31110 [Moorea sp. SIO4A3]|nr:hypothetical protein [Moorena sp. SIO4A3]
MVTKNIYYELKYLFDNIKFHKFLLIFFTLIGAIVISLGDAQAFFTGENSPIPKNWNFFRKKTNARIISLILIGIPSISVYLTEIKNTSEQTSEISKLIYKITLPYLEQDLNNFYKNLLSQFKLSTETRMYIMIPRRKGILQWQLQIIGKTNNLDNQENNLSLNLDEGGIGYVFQSISDKVKNQAKYIPLCDIDQLPSNYKHLSQNNKDIARKDTKGYLIVPIFYQNFLVGLFIVDTNIQKDLIVFENHEFHKELFNWIGNDNLLMNLIWRL